MLFVQLFVHNRECDNITKVSAEPIPSNYSIWNQNPQAFKASEGYLGKKKYSCMVDQYQLAEF